MTDDSRTPPASPPADRPNPTRRRLLAGAGGLAIAATAGCLDSVLDSSPQRIDPVEPSEPREGTPGEFYALLERNDLEVESLTRDDDTLTLLYHSAAETEEESIDEIGVVVEVFNENLVKNETDVELLVAEVVDPFDEQAHGWGLQAWWLDRFNDGEMGPQTLWSSILSSRVYGDEESVEAEAGSETGSEAEGNGDVETAGANETADQE